jgi:internalin A
MHIDFSFLNELPNLRGLECRMNISKRSDLGPLHKLKGLKQLAWPARTTPDVDLACFPELEYLSFRHVPSASGWQALSRLRVLRLSVAGSKDLKFLSDLKSLAKLEVADSDIESLAGIENLDALDRVEIFMLPQLADIFALAKSKNLRDLYVDKTKRLTDYSPLAGSRSLQSLRLMTPIDSVDFVPRIGSLQSFLCHEIHSNDLSALLRAKSLKHLEIVPEKRSYTPKVAEIKQSLGI